MTTETITLHAFGQHCQTLSDYYGRPAICQERGGCGNCEAWRQYGGMTRREANLKLLQRGLKWRMASKGFTCCQCKRAIPEHSTYASLVQYNAGMAGKIYPDRLHEDCLDAYLEKMISREREHLEAVAEISQRGGK